MNEMELRDIVVAYLKESKKALGLVEIINILLIKNLVSDKDRANLNVGKIKEICEDLKNNGIFIEKSPGKFAYNFEVKEEPAKTIEPKPIPFPPGRGGTNLDLMWEYAENKTNKKLAVDGVFNYFAQEKEKGDLEEIIMDFMDYFKIEKNKQNVATWEQNFGNALIVQGIITKWD